MTRKASNRFPRGPLIGMWGLAGFALVAAAAVRLSGNESSRPTSAPVLAKEFRFKDMADGSVAVLGPSSERPVDVVSPGSNGFLRATLRGLARERKRQGIGQEQPFRLTRWSDGRITLEDDSTARHVDLGSFGPTNAQAFARLLTITDQTP
jgi:putative photosynthetic complex assembly protein